MAKIGLIDVDGHHFPNLALMRISAYHKAQGDSVEWWWSDLEHYDIVYKSKVFSDAYSKDIPNPYNADKVFVGGTGYCINLRDDGKEHFDNSKNNVLPDDIEDMFPDYSIYSQHDFAVSMTSRGCPRGCPFCHVKAKEGGCAVKVANVDKFWAGQKSIEVCDPNITACKDKRDLFQQYIDTKAKIVFNQGLDIRLINDADVSDLNRMRISQLHFAWDNPVDDLKDKFISFAKNYKPNTKPWHGNKGMVYVLTNFEDCTLDEHIDRALYRVEILKSLGYDPYIMVYDKPNADKKIRKLQRYVNNKFVFYKCSSFEEYLKG